MAKIVTIDKNFNILYFKSLRQAALFFGIDSNIFSSSFHNKPYFLSNETMFCKYETIKGFRQEILMKLKQEVLITIHTKYMKALQDINNLPDETIFNNNGI